MPVANALDFDQKLVLTHSSCLIDEQFLKKYTHRKQDKIQAQTAKDKKKKNEEKAKALSNNLPERSKKYKVNDSSGGKPFLLLLENEENSEDDEKDNKFETERNMLEEAKNRNGSFYSENGKDLKLKKGGSNTLSGGTKEPLRSSENIYEGNFASFSISFAFSMSI